MLIDILIFLALIIVLWVVCSVIENIPLIYTKIVEKVSGFNAHHR